MQVGFVGIGTMGAQMAKHLSHAGHDVSVFDVSEDAMEAATEWGATPCDSPAAVADQVEIVFLSLPGPDQVRAVFESADGLGGALEEGMTVVDTTTTLPSVTDDIAGELAERGVDFLGAPVSGGLAGAKDQTLSIMTSGPRDAFERYQELFSVIASDVFYLGERPSLGPSMKLVNNFVSFTGFLATCEATILGQQAGLDLETILDVMNESSGRNSATEQKFPEYVVPETFDMGSSIALMEKDISLATEFGENHDTPMMVAEVIAQLIGYAHSYCGGDADLTQVYQFFEAMMSRD